MPRDKHSPSYVDHRARHRARSHQEAQAQAPAEPPAAVLQHPLVFAGKPTLVRDAKALDELVISLRHARCFAYDSEFIGELTYIPKLCLIQVATDQQVALIDPLTDLDLTPFWELIADPSITKIVHAGQQDLEPVVRHLDRPAANVFDTQIVAGFVGMAYPVSLSRLILELLEVKLGKGQTFTNWDQRPLSASQLRYAADDVRYLPAVHAMLSERVRQTGHGDWAAEECAALCAMSLYLFDPDTQLQRVRGSGSLRGRELAVLRELVTWRDGAAREHDVPPRALVKDEVLVDLSRTPARNHQKLDGVRGLPRPLKSTQGHEILAATARGLAVPVEQQPKVRQNDDGPAERFRVESLWSILQALCAGQRVDPALVSSRHDTDEFYHLVRHGGDVESHRLMRGWRRQAAGDALLGILRGQKSVTVHWKDEHPVSHVRED